MRVCIVSGRRNRDIAADLGVSEITVKSHRAKAMRKMEAVSLVDLLRKADRLGLTPRARTDVTPKHNISHPL